MKRRRCGLGAAALLAQALLLFSGVPSLTANAGPADVTPGAVGVFFDAAGTQHHLQQLVPFVTFRIYVLAFDVPGDLQQYEFGLHPPPGMLVGGQRWLPTGATDAGSGDDNWIVSVGGACMPGVGTCVLVEYTNCLFLSQILADTPVCLTGAAPSRFAYGAPGYAACEPAGALHPFGAAYFGCAMINAQIDPCAYALRHVTMVVGSGARVAGAPISLPITAIPTFSGICLSKSSCCVNVTHLELSLAWDPNVATLAGVRWSGDAAAPPSLRLVLGTGTASVVLERDEPPLFDAWNATALLWLDFSTQPQPGRTAVTVTQLARGGAFPGALETRTESGFIDTSTIPAETSTFGALKARWCVER